MSLVHRIDYANKQPKYIAYDDGRLELRYPNGGIHQIGTWTRRGGEYVMSGTIKTFYPDKKVKAIHHVNQQLLVDGWKVEYYRNGNVSAYCQYKNGVLHGPATTYAKNGLKLTECFYSMGKMVGTYRSWYASGKLQQEVRYQQGQETSRIVYHQTGLVDEVKISPVSR